VAWKVVVIVFSIKSIGVGTPDLLCFLQFRTLLEPRIFSRISRTFFFGCWYHSGRWTVHMLPSWVPKSKANLTSSLWYTLGTADEFEKKWPAIVGVPFKLPRQMAVKSRLNYPRGHPHRALDQRSSLRSSGSLGPYFTHRGSNMRYIHVLDLRGEDENVEDWR